MRRCSAARRGTVLRAAGNSPNCHPCQTQQERLLARCVLIVIWVRVITAVSALVKAVGRCSQPFLFLSCNLLYSIMTRFKSFQEEDLTVRLSTKLYSSREIECIFCSERVGEKECPWGRKTACWAWAVAGLLPLTDHLRLPLSFEIL